MSCKMNTTGITAPGNALSRFILQLWTFFIKFVVIGIPEITSNVVCSCPKLDLKEKHTGKICVLTGGARGIGIEIVKALLTMDYTVIAGVRNKTAMDKELNQIRAYGVTSGKIKLFYLDLKSISSVKNFANEVLACPEANCIDMLINNAGIYQDKYEVTPDNLEVHFQVNYLSHFYLTDLLLPRIKKTAKFHKDTVCHIINTSSCLHYGGNLNFNNLATRNLYDVTKCYFDTKLCQVMHAKIVQTQIEQEGIENIQMYAVHPGAIKTDIWRDAGWINIFMGAVLKLCRTPEEGAHLILHPALSLITRNNCGGKYFSDGKEKQPNHQADNFNVRQQLLDMSVKIINNVENTDAQVYTE